MMISREFQNGAFKFAGTESKTIAYLVWLVDSCFLCQKLMPSLYCGSLVVQRWGASLVMSENSPKLTAEATDSRRQNRWLPKHI